MAKKLNAEIHTHVKELSAQGDTFLDAGEYFEAQRCYAEALGLLPGEVGNWEAATWLLASIGDCLFRRSLYEKAHGAFVHALGCPGGLGNPFIHLRLGQCQLEMGVEKEAADELTRAFMGAGKEIFDAEDPKYLVFLKTKLLPPAGGW